MATGLPHRTARTQAIANGTKVPATPQAPPDYCAACGYPHPGGHSSDPANSMPKSTSRPPAGITPFVLKGGK